MNDASDWAYVSEGGRHALFAYKSTSKPLDSWIHRLLRIDKSVLTQAAHRILCPRCSAANAVPETEECSADTFDSMVHALLTPYVDLPENVMLSWTFVADLYERTVRSGVIPRLRLGDWKGNDCHSSRNGEYSVPMGYLLRDYRIFASRVVPSTSLCPRAVLCWEFKPKAGYTAISPLVAASRHCKFTRSRFSLLQKVYCEGKVTKGWMDVTASSHTETFQSSLYDPMDLFSGNIDRIRHALHYLIACPQNNLKIWMGGNTLILGASVTESLDLSALREALGMKTHQMVDLVAHILYKEPFLSNLLRLQKLDVIDADGAIVVYRRLVHLCNGDMDRADSLADNVRPSLPHENPMREASHKLTPWNGTLWPRPSIAPNLDTLQREIENFQILLEMSLLKVPNFSLMNESRQRSLDIIGRLTCEECCYLLQAWLLSLTMSDLSFFVTLRPAAIDDYKRNQLSEGSRDDCFYLISRQQRDALGCVASRVSRETNCWVVLNYEVKAIDIDRKPARKLRSRETKEVHFDTL